MAGLPTKSDSALQQWHHLFESRGDVRSLQAQQHWQQLMRVGLPTRKHENWKYTPLDTLLSQQFVLPDAPQTLSAEQVDALALRWMRSVWSMLTVSSSQPSAVATAICLRFSTAWPPSAVRYLLRFSLKSSCI